MASSLVTGAETLTLARRKTSSSKLSLSRLGTHVKLFAPIPKPVSSCGLNLSMGAGRFGPNCSLSADSPVSEPSLYQLRRKLGSSKRSIVEEEGGNLIFPIVGDHVYVSAGRQNFKLQQEEDPSNLSFWEEWSWNGDISFLWISAAPCGVMAWLTTEQEAYARENLGSNMVYEIGELFELGIQLSYLLILLGLLGVGTFFVIRQVLVRRELDLSAKELQEQVRSGDASATEYFELGAVMLRRKFYPAAMKYLQQAIGKWDGDDQDLAQVYNALGVCYVRDGKLEKGIAQFEKAVKLQPGYVTAWNNLGDAYEKKKDLDAALKAFEEVLLFDPNNQVARPRRDSLKDRAEMFKGVSIKSKDS